MPRFDLLVAFVTLVFAILVTRFDVASSELGVVVGAFMLLALTRGLWYERREAEQVEYELRARELQRHNQI